MAATTITPAERIRELSAINAEVADMLQSAGYAINSLSNRPLQPASGEEDTDMTDEATKTTMNAKKDAFAHHTEAYYNALQSVVARLRRQAYALEEAGIIAPEASLAAAPSVPPKPAGPATAGARGPPAPSSQQAADRVAPGNLDVGWLNSRGNRVGMEKDAELIEEAKELLENVLNRDDDGMNGG